MRRLPLLLALATASTAHAGWHWRDLDPFNRHSAVRAAGRAIDPFHALGRAGNRALHHLAFAVSTNPEFRERAQGWTTHSCQTLGISLAVPIIALKGAGYCATVAAAEPVLTTSCTAALAAGATAIVDIACMQLCHDGHLRDCQ
jgi:hypothetical protein